jgi:hypothetical protein
MADDRKLIAIKASLVPVSQNRTYEVFLHFGASGVIAGMKLR